MIRNKNLMIYDNTTLIKSKKQKHVQTSYRKMVILFTKPIFKNIRPRTNLSVNTYYKREVKNEINLLMHKLTIKI